ncbi:hypothetical protein K7X08_026039 [Anisodus acutangulus]|uniref:Uncharacterized protein n=1 Tax=Anisodus acutangulus TaxID=402998 RepID=A0A9Q1RUQ9_9SOLA|nr:hypothetical protein K7X08_026039 [Anisodus acutangulus]
MDVFSMKKPCSSEASSISATSEESHEVVTNTKKMKEKGVEGSQLKPHELSYAGVLLYLKVHNGYNNKKNINGSIQLRLTLVSLPMRQRLSKSVPQKLGFSLTASFGIQGDSSAIHKPSSYQTWPFFSGYNYRFNPKKWSSSSSSFFRTENFKGNSILGASLENSLNFEKTNSAKGFNLMDSPINVDNNLRGNNYMKMGLGKEDAKKNNGEEEPELDLNLKL